MSTQPAANPAMAEALKSAGITMPAIQRVWNVIKEAGRAGILSTDVYARLKAVPSGSVSVSLNSLSSRGMITRTAERARSGRMVYRYATDMETYKLLPMVRPTAPAPAPAANPTGLPEAAPAPAAKAPTASVADPETLNALSLGCVMSAWIAAGLDPAAVLLMPVSQFIRAAAKRGLVVTLQGK